MGESSFGFCHPARMGALEQRDCGGESSLPILLFKQVVTFVLLREEAGEGRSLWENIWGDSGPRGPVLVSQKE